MTFLADYGACTEGRATAPTQSEIAPEPFVADAGSNRSHVRFVTNRPRGALQVHLSSTGPGLPHSLCQDKHVPRHNLMLKPKESKGCRVYNHE